MKLPSTPKLFSELATKWGKSADDLIGLVVQAKVRVCFWYEGPVFYESLLNPEEKGEFNYKNWAFPSQIELEPLQAKEHAKVTRFCPVDTNIFPPVLKFATREGERCSIKITFDDLFLLSGDVEELENDYPELVKGKKKSVIEHEQQDITKEKEKRPNTSQRSLTDKDKMLMLIYVMAVVGYGYDPEEKKSDLTSELSEGIAGQDLSLSDDTIRKILKESLKLKDAYNDTLPPLTNLKEESLLKMILGMASSNAYGYDPRKDEIIIPEDLLKDIKDSTLPLNKEDIKNYLMKATHLKKNLT